MNVTDRHRDDGYCIASHKNLYRNQKVKRLLVPSVSVISELDAVEQVGVVVFVYLNLGLVSFRHT